MTISHFPLIDLWITQQPRGWIVRKIPNFAFIGVSTREL